MNKGFFDLVDALSNIMNIMVDFYSTSVDIISNPVFLSLFVQLFDFAIQEDAADQLEIGLKRNAYTSAAFLTTVPDSECFPAAFKLAVVLRFATGISID